MLRGGDQCAPAGDAWECAVTTNAQNEDVQVRWPSLGTLPREYRMTLVDAASGARRRMRTTTGYVFHADRGTTQRSFRIEIGANDGTNLQRANVQLSRVGPGYQVAYSLTKESEVKGRLINPAGKIINSVPVTRGRAGFNSLTFDAKDSLGQQSARGVYLFELVAQNEEGEQVKAIKSVVVK